MITIQIRQMYGENIPILIESVANVGELKREIMANPKLQATDFRRIKLCFNYAELYPDEKRLDRCCVKADSEIDLLTDSEPPIYSLMDSAQHVDGHQIRCTKQMDEYHIELHSMAQQLHTLNCMESIDPRQTIYFTVNIETYRSYFDNYESMIRSHKRAFINIGDIQLKFGSSFVFSYDATKGQLAAMRIGRFGESVKESQLAYLLQSKNPANPANPANPNILSFSIDSTGQHQKFEIIVKESTRTEIDKINNLILKYTGSTEHNMAIEVF